MPIKPFTCQACGEKFELVLLSRELFDKADVASCPECNALAPADEVPLVARRAPYHGIQS